MAMRIDTAVLRDMKTFGAFDISACFNCGNCTAVCPLSKDSVAFPRRMIRYAQLGQKENVIASRELWLCYYCAECSDTCPRQAEPGEFMASARRFAIAGFDPTTIARRLYVSAAFTWLLLAIVFAALLVILAAGSPGWPAGRVTSEALLTFVPYETIHWLGVGVGGAGAGLPARGGALRPRDDARGGLQPGSLPGLRHRETGAAGSAARAPLVRPLLDHDGHDRARTGDSARLLLQDAGVVRADLVAGATARHRRRRLSRIRRHRRRHPASAQDRQVQLSLI